MSKEMSLESASLNTGVIKGTYKERLLKYKTFSVAFAYPDDDFFSYFPGWGFRIEELTLLYDQLFRAKGIWLYTTEYLAKNEFEKSRLLADIMGFYRAFGLQPDKERPDCLSTELEFMHYLMFKEMYALTHKIEEQEKKADLCQDAQAKFFHTHLYPGAKNIAQNLISQEEDSFYKKVASELLMFLESEKAYLHPGSKA
jgi:TorA maturation chaperone TorD